MLGIELSQRLERGLEHRRKIGQGLRSSSKAGLAARQIDTDREVYSFETHGLRRLR